jgi:DNA-binding Xre family transcriptional regulator
MASRLGYAWDLRLRMAEQGMFNSPELAAALRERGVTLSDSQVWRLVTGTPERLNLRVLVALCDILGCTPNDLIEPVELSVERPRRRGRAVDADVVPKPARVKKRGQGR